MYHGIVIDKSLINPELIKNFSVIHHKQDGEWKIYCVEIDNRLLEKTVEDVQKNLNTDQPWYAHFYNEDDLVVVFKEKVFNVTLDKSSWSGILMYGKQLGIPAEQLELSPIRIEEEGEYFNV